LLGWVALGVASVQLLLTFLNERGVAPTLAKANSLAIQSQQFLDNSQRNAEVVNAMGMLAGVRRRWMGLHAEMLQLQAAASLKASGFQAALKGLQLGLSSILLGLAAWLVLREELWGGAGMMIVASVLGGRLLAPAVQALGQWRSLVASRGAWARLNDLLRTVPARTPAMPLPAPKGKLSVEAVVAAAPRGADGGPPAPILRGIQLALAPGEVLVVAGPSGSGKTSLARVLVGLWPTLQGKVRLDGADVFGWNKDELGAHIGYLPQDVELIDGTVGENIARFTSADPAAVVRAVELAGLQDLIASLPQGLDTPVGPAGTRLSGGQRQRVALARALYGDPVLLVLDEPSASLDDAGDRALVHALNSARQRQATVVIITHRRHLLPLADKMLVLRDGSQHAFGPRDEVLKALSQPPDAPARATTPAGQAAGAHGSPQAAIGLRQVNGGRPT
jgi:ATP-binding cassette, subfamily C, bacterial exporter for protease/lipase